MIALKTKWYIKKKGETLVVAGEVGKRQGGSYQEKGGTNFSNSFHNDTIK
jgi:hypothetical protein